jgi:hypothetical protein
VGRIHIVVASHRVDVLIGVDWVSGNDRLDGGSASDTCVTDRGDAVSDC